MTLDHLESFDTFSSGVVCVSGIFYRGWDSSVPCCVTLGLQQFLIIMALTNNCSHVLYKLIPNKTKTSSFQLPPK